MRLLRQTGVQSQRSSEATLRGLTLSVSRRGPGGRGMLRSSFYEDDLG